MSADMSDDSRSRVARHSVDGWLIVFQWSVDIIAADYGLTPDRYFSWLSTDISTNIAVKTTYTVQ